MLPGGPQLILNVIGPKSYVMETLTLFFQKSGNGLSSDVFSAGTGLVIDFHFRVQRNQGLPGGNHERIDLEQRTVSLDKKSV
jgi:hypothetical protein